MAKVQAPLQSFSARGKLANAVVHFPWKGLHVVREYVVPANPRSAAQVTQRALMTAAVAAYHTAEYTAADSIALNRWAGTIKAALTGFNAMIRAHITEGLLGNTWEDIKDGQSYGAGAAGFSLQVTKASGGDAPTVHYGTRRTFFPDSVALADQGGNVWAVTLAGLSASTLYYFYVAVGASADDWGRTGIYQQRTTA